MCEVSMPTSGNERIKRSIFGRSSTRSNEIELSPNVINEDTLSNAVVIRNAFKNYGNLKVLEDFNMTVPKGGIYALLGVSGCGKTTLLECITGRKGMDHGNVYVLNQKLPNAKNETRIGYMPQVTGLYMDLTIKETFKFFGCCMDMNESKIKERTEYFTNLLQLPEENRQICTLSGGQQRRISLVVALLHEGELLILDEPTVGIDSVLRQLIWDHFLSLTENGTVTIIITTHYIEEAVRANLVGLMRGGCLLVESAPDELLRQHEVETLESVFCSLSLVQDRRTISSKDDQASTRKIQATNKTDKIKDTWSLNKNHVKALTWKNAIWYWTNPPQLFLFTIFPLMTLLCFWVAIGRYPVNFLVAVTNLEMENQNCANTTLYCESNELSCNFLRYIEKNQITLKFYNNEEYAIRSVFKGETKASITLKRNYSSSIRSRIYDWHSKSLSEMEQSTIDVVRDLSDTQFSKYIELTLYTTLQNFSLDLAESCGIRKEIVKQPFMWNPIYGSLNSDFTDFFTPGLLVSVTFVISIATGCVAMIIESKEASLDRLIVMGINKVELITAHFIVDSAICVFQITTCMLLTFGIFKVTAHGSLLLTFIILTLVGFTGIWFGFLISCGTTSEAFALMLALGSFLCSILTSGIVWPLEAVHWLLKLFILYLPLTKPIVSIKSILHKGWSIWTHDVYIGFVSISVWMLIFIVLAIIAVKRK